MLAVYAQESAPDLAAPERVGYAIDRLCDWWGDRRVDAVRPETCRQYRRHRIAAGRKDATAGKELDLARGAELGRQERLPSLGAVRRVAAASARL